MARKSLLQQAADTVAPDHLSATFKRMVLRSPFVGTVTEIREILEVLWIASTKPENLGMVTNDHLSMQIIGHLCKPGGLFIDVGAHLGTVIDAVLKVHADVRVMAIEAVAEKAEFVQSRFPEATVHHVAAGPDDRGEVTFYVNTESAYSGLARSTRGESVEVRVPMRSLDSLVGSARVDLIKIDVEGAELGVLRGGKATIDKFRPAIMFESGPQQDDGLGYKKEELWQWFTDHDYSIVIPNRVAHDGEGLTMTGFAESHLYPRRTTNYFALPNDRRVEVRDHIREVLGVEVAAAAP